PFSLFHDPSTPALSTLSLHDALPILAAAASAHHFRAHHAEAGVGLLLDRLLARRRVEGRPAAARVVLRVGDEQLGSAARAVVRADRKSTRLNSSHLVISYAVFCLKKK